jgi:hypothetical protein
MERTTKPVSFIEAVRSMNGTPAAPAQSPAPRTGQGPPLGFENAVITAECARVRAARVGNRNRTLNDAAFNLAQVMDPGMWESELTQAALDAGLDLTEIARTIQSGVKGAGAKPRPAHRMPSGRPSGPVQDLPALDGYEEAEDENRPVRVDWASFWTADWAEDWLLEPLILRGGQTVVYSAPKTGKSLLSLELAAGLATGHKRLLGVEITEPSTVMYIDHENRLYGEIRDRLTKMGYGPDDDLSNLHYFSLQRFSPLDQAHGAAMLIREVEEANADLVIIDTASRTISGDENDNTTWLNWYRHTGKALKERGVSLLRLDHTGKDESKGQRGGSAKSGDVDLVWSLETVVKEDTYLLRCTDHRVEMTENLITLKRKNNPTRHEVDGDGFGGAMRAKADFLMRRLDETGAPRDLGVVAATNWLREQGESVTNGVLTKQLMEQRALGTL